MERELVIEMLFIFVCFYLTLIITTLFIIHHYVVLLTNVVYELNLITDKKNLKSIINSEFMIILYDCCIRIIFNPIWVMIPVLDLIKTIKQGDFNDFQKPESDDPEVITNKFIVYIMNKTLLDQ